RVEVEAVLLEVLAVIAFRRHQSEEALLEDGIALVPEGHCPAEDLVAVAEAGDAVLAPAIGLGARQIVGEPGPRVGVGAVVLAYRSPGAVGEIRPPLAPARDGMRVAGETL